MPKLPNKDFISKATKIHGNKYDYSKVNYIKSNNKVIIICRTHGEFKQRGSAHLDGQGCKKCGFLSPLRYKKDINHFISKATKIHGNKYDYSKVNYKNSSDKIIIVCKTHGEFKQRGSAHLDGQGCKKCVHEQLAKTDQQFVNQATKIHDNKYDYSKVNYKNSSDKIIIVCKTHGEFKQLPSNHLKGKGCPKCGHERSTKYLFSDTNKFVNQATKIHDNKYDYSKVNYKHSKEKVIILCKIHGEFKQRPNDHLNKYGCPKCAGLSTQLEIYQFMKSHIDCEFNDKTVIFPYEIDIYVPVKHFGVELNGIYWHSYNQNESRNERMAHYDKYELCKANNISLLQTTDIEWHQKSPIIKSMILHRLGRSQTTYARHYELYIPTKEECKVFFTDNHIQGHKYYSYAIALKINGIIMSIMAFNRHPKCQWEITRFATKLNHSVVGGASKLFNKFKHDINPDKVLTYADLRFSDGAVYKKLGFKFDGHTKPNYCYIKRTKVFSRQRYQKHKLFKKLKTFDKTLSEAQNMFNNGYRRMWDAGHNRYLYIK